MVKFYLVNKSFDEGRVLADGVILAGKLKLGDIFNFIERYEEPKSLKELIKEPSKIDEKVKTTMKVMAMSMYGTVLEEVEQGMECRLILVGWDNIRPNDVLIIEEEDK